MSEDVQQSASPPVQVGRKLFSYRAVGVASVLGGPLAGSILMGLNYRRLGNGGAAVKVIVFGILITGLLIWAGWFIPGSWQRYIGIGLAVAMIYYAKSAQGRLVDQHINMGGKLASMWSAAGVGLAIILPILAITLGYTFMTNPMKEVTIGTKDKVYYLEAATEQDAKALGEQLKAIGYFQDRGVAAEMVKGKDGVTVGFVVHDGIWDNPKSVSAFTQLCRQIAPAVGGLPFKLRLLDSHGDTKKEVKVEPDSSS
jgi:hypothetical protein